jgi:hypothetical protein
MNAGTCTVLNHATTTAKAMIAAVAALRKLKAEKL